LLNGKKIQGQSTADDDMGMRDASMRRLLLENIQVIHLVTGYAVFLPCILVFNPGPLRGCPSSWRIPCSLRSFRVQTPRSIKRGETPLSCPSHRCASVLLSLEVAVHHLLSSKSAKSPNPSQNTRGVPAMESSKRKQIGLRLHD
jgi:hypothetical protein